MMRKGYRFWEVNLSGETMAQRNTNYPPQFTKLVALWIPRQFVTSMGVDVTRFIADVNDKVLRRGFILWDGQILATPMNDSIDQGIVMPKPVVLPEFALRTASIEVGKRTTLICEGAPDFAELASSIMFGVPPQKDWQSTQREYFGLENPYQMAEDAGDYTQNHIMTRIREPYLFPTERIAAILDGMKDNHYFCCPCHQAEVVYTTRHRLVCMGCGAMHVVLRQPVPLEPKRLLTDEEWFEFFDDTGSRRDEEIDMSIVDFRDIEEAETIWTTDQWEEAKHEFVFFARSSPEEIAEAIRGTEADPSVFLEAGWTPTDTSPPPAHQIAYDSIDIDLIENAAHAFREGVSSYIGARMNSERLVSAIPQLFRAVELLLKAKLQDLEPQALDDNPNNPAVLNRLALRGVMLTRDELDTLMHLRRLRNDLQHGTAKFNHRRGLTLCRSTIILVNRFAYADLGLWIGNVIPSDDWQQLLKIEEIVQTTERVVECRLAEIRVRPEISFSFCTHCRRHAMIRPHQKSGASCAFCGYVPVKKEEDEE